MVIGEPCGTHVRTFSTSMYIAGTPLTNGAAPQNKSPALPRKMSEPFPDVPAFPIPDSLDFQTPPSIPAKVCMWIEV